MGRGGIGFKGETNFFVRYPVFILTPFSFFLGEMGRDKENQSSYPVLTLIPIRGHTFFVHHVFDSTSDSSFFE
jgi:hypothetical protein